MGRTRRTSGDTYRAKGFGTRLVESSLAGELGADVQIVYHFDGVVCTMRARLQRLQQDISPMAAP